MLLYRPGGKEKPRARAFSEEELQAFLHNLDDACRFQRLPHILRVLLLTLQRRSELALAEWREFDLRRTGRTGLARLGVKIEIAERVLNHARERMEATYDVHDYIEEKREALERWAEHLVELRDARKSCSP